MTAVEEQLHEITVAARWAVIEMLSPGVAGNRLEQSLLPELYSVMNEKNREVIAKMALASCFSEYEKAFTTDRINELEKSCFGKASRVF